MRKRECGRRESGLRQDVEGWNGRMWKAGKKGGRAAVFSLLPAFHINFR
jgi:hypothetical protein